MTVLIKIVLCSTLFIALYKVILENERMFRFNRFYLLFSLISAVVIPFLTFTHSVKFIQIPVQYLEIASSQNLVQVNQPSESAISLEKVVWLIYGIGFLYFLLVFLKNIIQIFQTIKNSEKIHYRDYTLVRLDKKVVPHSFLNYIFISDSETVENDILLHELTHIQQLHTWDILFIELYKVFFWFNPAVYFYRSSMMLNHEFLADEKVLKSTNVTLYQHLLLQNVMSISTSSSIIHGFNYSIIKKRLIMMTKKKSPSRIVTKAIIITSLSICIGFLLMEEVVAQTLPEKDTLADSHSVNKRTGATDEEVNKFNALIEKYKTKDGNIDMKNIPDEEKKLLVSISEKMTPEQLFSKKEVYIFSTSTPQKFKIHSYDFERWTSNKNYRIYIDKEKVSNKTLKKHSPEDFNQYMLTEGKKENSYRVDLTTVAETARILEEAKHNPNYTVSRVTIFNKGDK